MTQAARGGGWIRSPLREDRFKPGPRTLAAAVDRAGRGFTDLKPGLAGEDLRQAKRFIREECNGDAWSAWLPKGQATAPVSETHTLWDDGNFIMQALRTRRFLFLVCFATS